MMPGDAPLLAVKVNMRAFISYQTARVGFAATLIP